MSACSAQAISHVGCRLMVASSANTSRPFAPAVLGDIARAFATKAEMSSDADGLVSGNEPALPDPAFCAEVTSPAGFGLIGSPDISARKLQQALCGPSSGSGQCLVDAPVLPAPGEIEISVSSTSVLSWPVERNRARIGQCRWRLGLDRLERALVDEEFVKHVLDRCLGRIGTGIAHVVMLEAGMDDRNSSLLAY